LATNHREALSTRVRSSSRIRVWTSASMVLSWAQISSSSALDPKISLARKFARVSSAAEAPVSADSRWK
jgi:hypothetical protein